MSQTNDKKCFAILEITADWFDTNWWDQVILQTTTVCRSEQLEVACKSAYLRKVKWRKHKEKEGRRKSHFTAGEGG